MHSTKSQSKEICALSYYLPYFIGNYTKSMDLWNWSLQPTSDAEIKSMVKGFQIDVSTFNFCSAAS